MNEFSHFIKTIGRGKRTGRYLSQDEAYRAFSLLLEGSAEPEQVGAFLMLLRVREEAPEELAGFVQACRNHSEPSLAGLQPDLDLGCYAGKRRHLPWFLLAVLCLAQSGRQIFLHGAAEPDSQRLYLAPVFAALDLPIAQSTAEAKTHLQNYGLTYCGLEVCNPKLFQLLQMRTLFGLRSPASTLARMLNPSQARFSFHGVFHKHFDQRHVETARLIGDNQVSCLRGEGGEVEVNPERPLDQYILRDGKIHTQSFPALLAKPQIKPRQLDIQQLARVWRGQSDSEYAEQAVIGTLASMLSLMDYLTPNAALAQAQTLWRHRAIAAVKVA